MSLCYDFQKWRMITLATFAISPTVGLINLVYGEKWNTTEKMDIDKYIRENIPLWNFTRTAQNGTEYNCQKDANDVVLWCTPIGVQTK